MKRIISMLGLLLCLGIQSAEAQNVWRGRVVDSAGNPIPGAKVENAKGKETTTTGIDGSFALQADANMKRMRVTYAGMKPVTCKPEVGNVIEMRKATWWNTAPEKYKMFLGPVVAFNHVKPSYGVMVGVVKNWGAYFKADVAFGDFSTGCIDYEDVRGTKEELMMRHEFNGNKPKFSRYAISAGVMRKVAGSLYVMAGGGYSTNLWTVNCQDGTRLFIEPYSYHGGMAELGLMLKVKHLYVGATAMTVFGAETCIHDGSCDFGKLTVATASIGYSF